MSLGTAIARRGLECAVILGTVSCDSSSFQLAWPSGLGDAEVALVGVISRGSVQAAWALHVDALQTFEVGDEAEETSLELFIYEQRTQDVVNALGKLEPRTVAVGGVLPPVPAAQFILRDLASDADFSPLDPDHSLLRDFAYAGPAKVNPCPTPQVFAIDPGVDFERPRLIEVDAEHALVLAGTSVLLYTLGGGTEDLLVSRCISEGFKAADGALYLGTCSGDIVTGRLQLDPPSLQLRQFKSGPPEIDRFLWLDGGEGLEGMELVGTSELGTSAFFDGHDWQFYDLLPPRPTDVSELGGAIWLGPSEAMTGAASDARPVSIRNGTAELIPTDSMAGVSALALIPAFGPVVGDSEAAFWLRAGSRFESLGFPPAGAWTTALIPYLNGFAFGTPFGGLGRYSPTTGMCPLERVGALEINDLAVLGDHGMLVVGTPTVDQRVTLLELDFAR